MMIMNLLTKLAVSVFAVAALALPASAAFASTTLQQPDTYHSQGSEHPGYPGGPNHDYCPPMTRYADVQPNCFPPSPPKRYPVQDCKLKVVVFNMKHDSALITEVYGPRLHVNEAVNYNGQGYFVESVWGPYFTVDQGGYTTVNHGPSIWDGKAYTLSCKTLYY
jgi:hypothetical protein